MIELMININLRLYIQFILENDAKIIKWEEKLFLGEYNYAINLVHFLLNGSPSHNLHITVKYSNTKPRYFNIDFFFFKVAQP